MVSQLPAIKNHSRSREVITDACQNIVEGCGFTIVECPRFRIRIRLSRGLFTQDKGFVLVKVRLNCLTEPLGLVFLIRARSDKFFHGFMIEQAIHVNFP